MSRIVQPPAIDGTQSGEGDHYLDRVAKYIPAEIVAAYLALQGLFTVAFEGQARMIALIVSLAIAVVFTPFYVRMHAKQAGYPWGKQAIISAVAVIFWAYALVALPTELGLYNGAVAAGALIVFTLFVGVFVPQQPKS